MSNPVSVAKPRSDGSSCSFWRMAMNRQCRTGNRAPVRCFQSARDLTPSSAGARRAPLRYTLLVSSVSPSMATIR